MTTEETSLRHARALLFDMDGVLVDTTASYRETVVRTVGTLAERWGFQGPPPSGEWVDALKAAGGFNSDWDLSIALLRGLERHQGAFDGQHFGVQLGGAGGGLLAVDRLLGATSDARFAARGVIQDVFQQIYLGASLYRIIERREPPAGLGAGLIDAESAMVRLPVLASLAMPTAIATGRPTLEAEHALDTFGFRPYFGALVTYDDCVQAGQRGKPDPWCVLEAARRVGVTAGPDVWYIGDTIDDVRAARAAGCSSAGIAESPASQARLREAGAHRVAASVEALLDGDPHGRCAISPSK